MPDSLPTPLSAALIAIGGLYLIWALIIRPAIDKD